MLNHRHTRGKVLDLNSEVCANSYLDQTIVGEAADVYESNFSRSWIDTSKVIRTVGEDADIKGSELFACAVDSATIYDSKLYETKVLHSKLTNVQARGSIIYGCDINADVQVGQAELIGLEINKPMRIGVGYWDRVPRSFEIKNDIADFVVTESTEGHAYVGCQRRPMLQWIKGKERYRKVMLWPQEIIDEIEANFLEWLK